MTTGDDIVAVVVTYHPRPQPLLHLLDALSRQVGHAVVVDNSEDSAARAVLARRERREHCIAFGENRGIAAAHNAGIAWARTQQARYVVLFDQDSEPAPDMVAQLAAAAAVLDRAGQRFGALGPRFVDPRQPGLDAFAGAKPAASPFGLVPVDHVISSGCLIPLATLDAVGGMYEALFIDYVDIEWGLRAQHAGYASYGVPGAVLHHALGDEPITALGREFPAHAPLRHYYRFRNAVWLYRQPWPARAWKITDAWRLAKRCVFVALFAPPRLAQVRMMSLGIWHGWRGRLGRIDAARAA